MTHNSRLADDVSFGLSDEDRTELRGRNAAECPSPWNVVFASMFTPTWCLGLLLFFCMFLPAYRGCNDNTVHMYQALAVDEFSVAEMYIAFVRTWPFFFGLAVAAGTVMLAYSREPRRAHALWWCYACLITVHAILVAILLATIFVNRDIESQTIHDNALSTSYWVAPTVALLVFLLISRRYCAHWFNAAMAMQIILAFTASVALSYVIPASLIANRIQIGGKLAITCSVFLILSTVIQRMDGYRALTRTRAASPLRLNLKSVLLLMAMGGLACAWVGLIAFLGPN